MDTKNLKSKLEEARKRLDEKIEEAYSKNFSSFEKFEAYFEKESREVAAASRNYRMNKGPNFINSVPGYGHLMGLKEFVDCVRGGGFIDYDGSGEYVKEGMMSGITILPSDVKHGSIRKDFDQIVWFNR